MKGRSVKRMVVAMALAAATTISGMAEQVHAFSFGDSDLVLAIYGNNTEALYNLGNVSQRLTTGQSFSLDVSAGLGIAGTGTNPVKYTIFGHDTNSLAIWAATKFSPAQIDPGKLGLQNQFGFSIGMSSLGGFTGDTVAKADGQSFSTNLNPDGSGTMGGSWPVAMQGSLGDVLNVLKGDVNTNTFTQVGRVLLTAGGLLTIGNPGPSAVPLPAGVVLFGTGVIGLIGIARRSFNKMAA